MKTFPFSTEILLENELSRLEPLGLQHYDGLVKIALAHPKLLQYSPSYIGNEAALRNYIEIALQQKKEEGRYPFVLIHKPSNTIAGSSSFGNISNVNQHLEIGWTWIGKEFQGTGFNKNNKFLMFQYAFETLDFERVEFRIDARNKQSRRAVEKIGGQYEGTLRSHVLMRDGHRRNTTFYSVLKEEWPGVKVDIFKR